MIEEQSVSIIVMLTKTHERINGVKHNHIHTFKCLYIYV
jgi:hypothetical protein